jgi:hypothetical protein
MMNRREFITLLGSATAGLSGTRRQLHRLGRGTACRRCGGSDAALRMKLAAPVTLGAFFDCWDSKRWSDGGG